MRRPLRPADLFLLAAAAVVALTLLSSPAETAAGCFADLDPEGTSVVVCVVQRCRPAEGGYLLNISDAAGVRADAFCPLRAAPGPPANLSAARIWATPSDEPGFLYIARLEPLPAPVVREALIYSPSLIDDVPCTSPSTIPILGPGCAPPTSRWS